MVYHQHGCGGGRQVLFETLGHDPQLAEVLLSQGQVAVGEVAQAAVVADPAVPRRALSLRRSPLLLLQQPRVVPQSVAQSEQLGLEAFQLLQRFLCTRDAARRLMVRPDAKSVLGSVCESRRDAIVSPTCPTLCRGR